MADDLIKADKAVFKHVSKAAKGFIKADMELTKSILKADMELTKSVIAIVWLGQKKSPNTRAVLVPLSTILL